LVKRLGLGDGQRCVDFGCGTGTFAVAAGKSGAVVEAVDISRAMLARARRRAVDHGLRNVHFHYAGFLTYRHEGVPADVVVSQYALHHLPDFWKMPALLNIAEILKPGGIFYLEDVVFSFPEVDYAREIEAWFERVAKPPGEGFTRQDFATHLREEHSTFAWVLERMLERAGFTIEEMDKSDRAYGRYFCRMT
ncbi:MAG: class I SAM-dependent methyltransferase, partial [Kiloniellales bacterium]|nr:class I SAM-dependent methyltransferase [Kiloniellales bacterium]